MLAEGALTLREGRDAYLIAEGLPGDGGYRDDWVKFKVAGIPVVFPNSASRKRDAPIHDLHHVLTGYRTDRIGEAEVGAWEIASGCRGAALHLGFRVFGFLLPFLPRRLYRAFVRGRNSRNLYETDGADSVLACTIEQVQPTWAWRPPPKGAVRAICGPSSVGGPWHWRWCGARFPSSSRLPGGFHGERARREDRN
jgi:hypothetical protein